MFFVRCFFLPWKAKLYWLVNGYTYIYIKIYILKIYIYIIFIYCFFLPFIFVDGVLVFKFFFLDNMHHILVVPQLQGAA